MPVEILSNKGKIGSLELIWKDINMKYWGRGWRRIYVENIYPFIVYINVLLVLGW